MEPMDVGARRQQWVMKEFRRMLANLEATWILWRSRAGISHVGLSPGSFRLSALDVAAMSVSKVSPRSCWVGESVQA